jgi:hypothetical protein
VFWYGDRDVIICDNQLQCGFLNGCYPWLFSVKPEESLWQWMIDPEKQTLQSSQNFNTVIFAVFAILSKIILIQGGKIHC